MDNTLYHHGIKGMKWGIRRYQNEDGSLTAAGRKRLSKESKDDWSEDARTASKIRKKSLNQMTNSELRKLNERTQLEQNYRRLNPSSVSKGIAFAAAAAGVMGTAVNLYTNGDKVIKLGKTVGSKIVDGVGNMVLKDITKGLLKGVH